MFLLFLFVSSPSSSFNLPKPLSPPLPPMLPPPPAATTPLLSYSLPSLLLFPSPPFLPFLLLPCLALAIDTGSRRSLLLHLTTHSSSSSYPTHNSPPSSFVFTRTQATSVGVQHHLQSSLPLFFSLLFSSRPFTILEKRRKYFFLNERKKFIVHGK